jgi:uncharacterized membrane protein YdjX (TVP38/TMEM64 family)
VGPYVTEYVILAAMETPSRPSALQPHWEKLVPALLVVVIISLVSVAAMEAFGGVDRLRQWITGAGGWAPVVFVLLKASTYVIAPLSGTPFKILAGALFGIWEGLLLTTLGDVLGGSLNFWIARLLGRPGIRRFVGAGAIRQVDETIEHVGGWRALLAARLVLSSLYDFVSYAAGLANIPFRHYLWVTVVGSIPAAIVYVWIGDALTTGPAAIWSLLAVGGVLGFVMAGMWWSRRRAGS